MVLAITLIGYLAMSVFCTLLERIWPERPDQAPWRPDSWLDVCYTGLRIVLSVLLILMTAGVGRLLDPHELSAIGRQPAWLQILEILLLTDLLSYLFHRILHHTSLLWPIHAIHHSAEEIDWLVAARNHPAEPVLFKLFMNYPLYLAGFRPDLMAVVMPFVAIYSLLLHANLTWGYGPLGYLLASPAFHRWHHSSELPALDKNFAQLFSFYDFVFGTAYFPRGVVSQQYGLSGERIEVGIWAHLSHPFRCWLHAAQHGLTAVMAFTPAIGRRAPAPTIDVDRPGNEA